MFPLLIKPTCVIFLHYIKFLEDVRVIITTQQIIIIISTMPIEMYVGEGKQYW